MKKYIDKNVYDSTQERLKYIFSNFKNVLIAFSGGKDSGVLLNLAYDYAKKNNLTKKLAVYTMDYEADFEETNKYLDRVYSNDQYPDIKKYWLCLPVSAQCSVSMYSEYWIPWEKGKKEIWCRPMPKNKNVVNEDNVCFDFKKGSYGADVRIDFSKWYSSKYGKTAVLVGIRCDESLVRLAIMTGKRKHMFNKIKSSKKINEDTYSFYPLYDWKTQDIWKCNAVFDYDYNRIYDLMYMAGISPHVMRVASPFHMCGQSNLSLYKAISPNTWGKMVCRVNGVNFTSIYGGTSALGWKKITKPSHFTWEEYAKFLINTIPEDFRKKILYHINRLMDTWENKGYGRNEEVISIMKKEGVEIEHTGIECKKCTKPKYYEIVKIKNGFLDETTIPLFRKCPSWKSICIAIMKNDYSCQTLGCSRTKEDDKKRKIALEKYKNL